MFNTINRKINAAKRAKKDREFILEAALEIDDVIPGSDAELEDAIDVDSVPDEAYKKADEALEKIVSDPNYDDTEADELADDDYDEGEVSDDELDALITECCGPWLD